MKNYRMIGAAAIAAAAMASCYHAPEVVEEDIREEEATRGQRHVAFALQGAWTGVVDYEYAPTRAAQTRAALAESAMTDLWIYDYAESGELLGSVAVNKAEDPDTWAAPALDMAFGRHTVYVVASKGKEPGETVADNAVTLLWDTPNDTFLGAVSITIDASTTGAAVAMDRCVSRLSLIIDDKVPADAAEMVLTMQRRSFGLTLPDGVGTAAEESQSVLSAAAMVGKTGTRINLFTLCPSDRWTTAFTVLCRDAVGHTLAAATVPTVELVPNRTTVVRGALFSQSPALALSVNDEWLTDATVNF